MDEPDAELGRPVARCDDATDVGEEGLEVDVPDPRDVLPVGDRVVERDDEHRWDAGLERSQRLVGGGGVLDQEDDDRLRAGWDPLEAPERRAERRETVAHRRRRLPERERDRRGGRGVVDVVEARERQLDVNLSLRGDQPEAGAREPVEVDVARGHVEGRSRVTAVRAAVVAEVADVRGRVCVRRAAADAVLRVGGMLKRRPRVTRIVDAEAKRTLSPLGEVGNDGVVGVHD